MFRLLKVRPFTTKICLECMNYAEEKCLKIINRDSVDKEKNTICEVKNPKFFESKNMEYDLKKNRKFIGWNYDL